MVAGVEQIQGGVATRFTRTSPSPDGAGPFPGVVLIHHVAGLG